MEKKPTVLFVLYEGLAETVIDTQVLSHIRVMQEQGVAEFEVLAFDNSPDLYGRSAERQARAVALAQAPVWIHNSARPGSPFSVNINSHQLCDIVGKFKRKFTHIHARTEYSVLSARKLAINSCAKLIWDCRGDAAAEVSYRYTDRSIASDIKRVMRAGFLTHRCKVAAHVSDCAIFVSTPLYQKMSPWFGDKPYEILPSSAPGELFYYDPAIRSETRSKHGISADRNVYVYSGSIKSYQRFDDTVVMFSHILERDPGALFLVITPNVEEARKILSVLPEKSFILRTASINEMNALLNASDAAFMLRDPTPTNWVAAPTKFSEYCLTGLPVIMTNAVKGAYSMAAEYGNLIEVSDVLNCPPIPPISRVQIAESYIPVLSRRGQVDAYRRIYSFKNSANSLK